MVPFSNSVRIAYHLSSVVIVHPRRSPLLMCSRAATFWVVPAVGLAEPAGTAGQSRPRTSGSPDRSVMLRHRSHLLHRAPHACVVCSKIVWEVTDHALPTPARSRVP